LTLFYVYFSVFTPYMTENIIFNNPNLKMIFLKYYMNMLSQSKKFSLTDRSTNGCPKIGAKYPMSSHTIGAKYHKAPPLRIILLYFIYIGWVDQKWGELTLVWDGLVWVDQAPPLQRQNRTKIIAINKINMTSSLRYLFYSNFNL